ncbi:MAG TPA: hypothetical protein VD996_07565, partial [Chitinophagaceae bacterium]|nr:hypothetical protein [Chitinophagaceae bacterium]
MKPEMILQSDVLDILFEHRNKEYGAYALRKEYNRTLFKSLSGVLFVLMASVVFLYWDNRSPKADFTPLVSVDDSVVLISCPEIPLSPPETLPAASAGEISCATPRIVPDNVAGNSLSTLDEIS